MKLIKLTNIKIFYYSILNNHYIDITSCVNFDFAMNNLITWAIFSDFVKFCNYNVGLIIKPFPVCFLINTSSKLLVITNLILALGEDKEFTF